MKLFKVILVSLYVLLMVSPVLYGGDIGESSSESQGKGTREDPYILPQAVSKIKVDGKFDEGEWANTLKLDIAYETWPRENTPAPVKTECYMAYTKSYLYVGFRAFDPKPSKIRAYYFDRDKIFYDDMVIIFLDTFNDERRAYGFRSNPLGVQFDDIRSRTGASLAWDAIYNSVGKIYDWGYIVEMAIPFNQLRFQRTKEDQVWGINVRRIYPRDALFHLDHIKIDRNNGCLICQYVKLKGFKGASPGRNIEIVPTLTWHHTDQRDDMPEGEMTKLSEKAEGGFTVRWGFTPNMTLSGTINPDFSQVEADSLQLDINQPFALFYPERRPFFYEGSEFFSTNFNALYTRTMRDPAWGLKVTGKEGRHTLGAYAVRDELTNLIFPGSHGSLSTSLDAANTSSVFRYKYDFGRNYTVGALVTDREGDDYFNRVFGVDGDFQFTRKDLLRFQFIGSSTRYPDEVVNNPLFNQGEGEFGGSALDLLYIRDTRHWDIVLQYQDITEGFRADLGYMPQVNFRRASVNTGYAWIGKKKSWYRQLVLGGQYTYMEDQQGGLINSGGSISLTYDGPLQSTVLFEVRQKRETLLGQEFDQFQVVFYGGMKPIGNLEFDFNGVFGDRIDYDNVRLGKRVTLVPAITLKPNRHMRLLLSHTFEQLNVDNARLYTANISQLTGVYHFNVRTFLRAILQYVDYDFNVDNYLFPKIPEIKSMYTQFLFSYEINPRTVLFLGYNDSYLGRWNYDLTRKNRTFFVKVSYAWSL
ncbi:MAG: hypothetical protein GTO45_26825 [Candidatus Aminicenantes bacterium]|nr:hypothetical protein [Candidatus Aminicenantes bacterium]NIM82360.1 hypothetical protein [Candidatus Aminicenantes bacterium]NIN21743.1 hypothetical protein [Candidatus Aminicenantes bacterium]NIN45552.1 hypothetical protein [Candidatus Aminicenantes bacterium]NIN88383.1 hypothetical protein [Candidatus Aminicenantes bacterium]